jgi:aryl sulfotransferase
VIWLASFPKSGNTWLRILLANVLSRATEPLDINGPFVPHDIASDRGSFEDVTLADSSLLTDAEIERLRPIVHEAMAAAPAEVEAVVKTHDAFDLLPDGTPLLGRGARAAVYVVRDPRDVAISWAHFFACDIEVAIAMLADPDARLSAGNPQHLVQRLRGWSGHAASWLDQHRVPTRLVRYEDLLTDAPATFRGVLDFLGIAATDDDVRRATRHAELGELQRQERAHGFRERPRQANLFFRAGRAGQWCTELTAAQIAAIERRHGAMMTRLGYL